MSPVLAGGNAVGITSAGNDEGWSFTADLKTALAATDGYTVRIFLGAPKITVTAPVYRGGPVTGTTTGAPAGSTVSVTINGVTTEAAIGSDGAWSVGAPNKLGTFSVTAVVKNGFSTSAAGTASLEVVKETLAAPAVTSPANDSVGATPVTTIAGSGKPGATIVLAGDVTAKTVVDASGNWSYTIPESFSSIGGYTVNAKQTLAGWNDSATITSNFTIAPVAPAIVTPTNGQKFAFNEGPTVISGTNLADATVQLTVNGKKYTAVVDGTSWSVTLDAALATGPYTVTAVQLVGDDESLISTSTFEVQAEPQLKPTKNPAAAPTTAPAKVPSNKGDLAKTGASGSTLMLGGAGGLLLLGGAAFLLIRRRSAN
ncbi:LPXTG cell wall anchor domain-containing protein [Arthrobacter psychrolactophilus]